MGKDTFYPTDRLSEVVEADYRLVQVVSRFGIAMGFADKTISEVCHEQNTEVHTFLAVVNSIRGYQAGKSRPVSLDLVEMRTLLDYLHRTHEYLIHHQLPRMRRYLLGAIDCSGPGDVVFLLLKYFDMYVAEVQSHVKYEETEVHTYARRLLAGEQTGDERMSFHRHNEDFVNKLHELITIFLQYCPQEAGSNDALNDVVYDIYRIEEDLNMHCRIEDEMLIPLIHRLERRRPAHPGPTTTANAGSAGTTVSTSVLSDREKAVIICVAKGLSNKEIADQLFLSFNTVTTHRRNIARKLNIHSAAGLAIYCVINKLVKLEELKL